MECPSVQRATFVVGNRATCSGGTFRIHNNRFRLRGQSVTLHFGRFLKDWIDQLANFMTAMLVTKYSLASILQLRQSVTSRPCFPNILLTTLTRAVRQAAEYASASTSRSAFDQGLTILAEQLVLLLDIVAFKNQNKHFWIFDLELSRQTFRPQER